MLLKGMYFTVALLIFDIQPIEWNSDSYGVWDEWLRAFFVDDIRSHIIPHDLEQRLFRKLQLIDDAAEDRDLRSPPSNQFEKLRGNLAGYHSIRVNQQWRIIFQWDDELCKATDVYLDDHSYQ